MNQEDPLKSTVSMRSYREQRPSRASEVLSIVLAQDFFSHHESCYNVKILTHFSKTMRHPSVGSSPLALSSRSCIFGIDLNKPSLAHIPPFGPRY